MKYVFIFLLMLIVPLISHANCRVELAIAAGSYLQELKKAELQEYQGGGACKVLDAQIKKCTEKQKIKVLKVLNLKEVLGNICMPHLPPPTA